MGVRFACHACGKRLNIKAELAGRRGICPACSVRFRIPLQDTSCSTPVEASESLSSLSNNGSHGSVSEAAVGGTATATKRRSKASRRSAKDPAMVTPTVSNPPSVATPSTDPPDVGTTAQVSPESQASPENQGSPENQASTENHIEDLQTVLGDETATWYVRPPSGGQYGPADGPTMGQWIQEGRVAETAMLWRDGWPDWKNAAQFLPGGNSAAAASGPVVISTQSPIASDHAPASETSPAEINAREGSKTLSTNHKNASRRSLMVTVFLGLIFLVLLGVFIVVLTKF